MHTRNGGISTTTQLALVILPGGCPWSQPTPCVRAAQALLQYPLCHDRCSLCRPFDACRV